MSVRDLAGHCTFPLSHCHFFSHSKHGIWKSWWAGTSNELAEWKSFCRVSLLAVQNMTDLVVVHHFFIKTLMDEKCDLEYGLLSVFRFYAFSSGLRMSENGFTFENSSLSKCPTPNLQSHLTTLGKRSTVLFSGLPLIPFLIFSISEHSTVSSKKVENSTIPNVGPVELFAPDRAT